MFSSAKEASQDNQLQVDIWAKKDLLLPEDHQSIIEDHTQDLQVNLINEEENISRSDRRSMNVLDRDQNQGVVAGEETVIQNHHADDIYSRRSTPKSDLDQIILISKNQNINYIYNKFKFNFFKTST
jgi:hypothetical protein